MRIVLLKVYKQPETEELREIIFIEKILLDAVSDTQIEMVQDEVFDNITNNI